MVGSPFATRLIDRIKFNDQTSSHALLVWMVYGVLLVSCVGVPAVRRTQEARVLESAREMMHSGVHGWLIPTLNGQVRLQKPPLANWLAAISFSLFGVSEQSGRLYAAATAWLTVLMTAMIANRLFDRGIAILSGALLAGSYLFCRFTLLAETDGLANLWVMASIYCMLQARAGSRSVMWLHLSAAAIGVAMMAKASGAFALLFLVGSACVDRDWRLPWRWVKCGAPLTLAIIAAPWWLYALHAPEGKIIGKELDDVTSGEDHGKPLWVYLPQLFRDVAPWTLIMPWSLYQAIHRMRDQKGLLLTLTWLIAVFLPLCFIGNRQDHYLLPMMPPLMVFIAWSIQHATRSTDRSNAVLRSAIILTLFGTVLTGIALVVIPGVVHRPLRPIDWLLASMILPAIIAVTIAWRKHAWTTSVNWSIAIWMIVMPLILTLWIPTFYQSDVRSIARVLQKQFDDRPFVFHSDIVYLPLIFELGKPVEAISDEEAVLRRLGQSPRTVILSRIETDPLAHDAAVHRVMSLGAKDQHFDVYTAKP